jgi:hypothetical protein
VRSADDFLNNRALTLHLPLKYVCVELPEGGFEIRIFNGETLHAALFLHERGEKMVGAGFVPFDRDALRLMPDGMSSSFTTLEGDVLGISPDQASKTRGMVAVRRIFQEIVGDKIAVRYE